MGQNGVAMLNDVLFVLMWPAVIWACYVIIRTVEDAKEREQERRYNDVFWNDD